MGSQNERRIRRSNNTTRALSYQLEAARRAAGLEGMVIADDEGTMLAASGDLRSCDEVAARLAIVGRKVPEFHGVMFSDDASYSVSMKRFLIEDNELYMCAIGGHLAPRHSQMARSINGAHRILS